MWFQQWERSKGFLYQKDSCTSISENLISKFSMYKWAFLFSEKSAWGIPSFSHVLPNLVEAAPFIGSKETILIAPITMSPIVIFMYLLLHFGQWFRGWDGDLSKCFRCEPPVNIEVLGDSHLNKRTTVRVKGQRRAWEIVYLCGINRFKVIKWNKIIYICCHCLRGQCGLKLSLLSPIRLSTYVTVCEDSALFFVMLLNQIELT